MAGADRMTIEEVVRQVLRRRARRRDARVGAVAGRAAADGGRGLRADRRRARRAQPRIGRRIATAIGRGAGTRGRARSSCRSPRSVRAATSRASWSRAGAPSRRCSAVVQQAYVCGVSTRRVDQLVESLGLRISKSEVSRICAGAGRAGRGVPRRGRWRAATRICSSTPRSRRSATAAACVSKCAGHRPRRARDRPPGDHRPRRRRGGDRGVLDATSCGRWSRAAWSACSWRSPTRTPGLKAAIAKVLGAPWQRCTVHFLRDCLGHARRDQHGAAGGADPPDLQRRRTLAQAPATGSPKRSRTLERPAAQGRRAARGRRGRHPRLLRLPGRPLAQAPLDQSARALQPRDRPAHRRRRHLPRRPLADPPGRDARASSRTTSGWSAARYLSADVDGGSLLEERPPSTTPTRRSSSSNRPEPPTPSPTSDERRTLTPRPGT